MILLLELFYDWLVGTLLDKFDRRLSWRGVVAVILLPLALVILFLWWFEGQGRD